MESYKVFILSCSIIASEAKKKNKAAGSAALKGFSKYVEGLVSKTGSEFSPQSYSFALSI
jgi:hypothetical protein